ncbi:hypothetical protein AHMF7605_09810 [Adhaeribacter arboris]|uniref:Uncharacterized protein n=1 Tax=Adhaeribacter arboris TaxID=2072846 RepID=A0A2T2YE56_9BACT|nr:hypothetical protein AHMF7605_09810 [Adhaeribacter arboris]
MAVLAGFYWLSLPPAGGPRRDTRAGCFSFPRSAAECLTVPENQQALVAPISVFSSNYCFYGFLGIYLENPICNFVSS